MPWSSIEAPPTGCSLELEPAELLEQAAGGADDLGADPVARAGARSRRAHAPGLRAEMLRRTYSSTQRARHRSEDGVDESPRAAPRAVAAGGARGRRRARRRAARGARPCFGSSQQPLDVEPAALEPRPRVADRGEVVEIAHPAQVRARSARRPRPPRSRASTRRRCPLRRTAPRAPPPGRSAARKRREQPLVVEDPVKGRVREDGVDGLGERELEQVGLDQLDAVAEGGERLAGVRRSSRATRRRRHPSAGQALEQVARDAARAAAGVERRSRRRAARAGRGPPGPTPPGGRRPGRRSAASQSVVGRVAHSARGVGPANERRDRLERRRSRRRARASARSRRGHAASRCLISSSISKRTTPAAAVDGLLVEVDPRRARPRRSRGSPPRRRITGKQPVLRAVGVEDVGERGGDDRLEAEVLQRPDGVLARGAAAEVAAR